MPRERKKNAKAGLGDKTRTGFVREKEEKEGEGTLN